MNHRFRGRTWSDNPEPAPVRADPYLIERVALRVARNGSNGRWEAFCKSNALMRRLHVLGQPSGLSLLAIRIGEHELGGRAASALQLYLRAAKGLQSFRRATLTSSTRADLAALLALVGIKYHSYVGQPTDKVPARQSHPLRA